VRIPAAACGPGFNGGGRVAHLISLLDFMPTLLDAAGLPVPKGVAGRSVMPLLRREPVDWPEEVFIQISEAQVGRAIRTRRWKYSVAAPEKDGYSHPGSELYEEEFLYDLQADPYELTNLIGLESHRDVADELQQRLIQHVAAAGEKKPKIIPATPHTDNINRRVFPDRLYSGRDWRE